MSKHSQALRARAAARKIEQQFPETPEAKLMFAVIYRALSDAYIRRGKGHVAEARRFLFRNPIVHAELCGVDTEWIHKVLRDGGLER